MNIFIGRVNNDIVVLNPSESHHCFKVLRKRTGDPVTVIDGHGAFYEAELIFVSEKRCEARVTRQATFQKKRNYHIHIAIAPTKQIDRIEWMLEKVVEIGVDELSFVRCKNSERTVVKMDRLQHIVESAIKQSKQAYIPKLNELVTFDKILDVCADKKFIAHCFYRHEKIDIKNISGFNESLLFLIGPEGDFTAEEVELAHAKEFRSIHLGDNRLRTETSALYVVSAMALK